MLLTIVRIVAEPISRPFAELGLPIVFHRPKLAGSIDPTTCQSTAGAGLPRSWQSISMNV